MSFLSLFLSFPLSSPLPSFSLSLSLSLFPPYPSFSQLSPSLFESLCPSSPGATYQSALVSMGSLTDLRPCRRKKVAQNFVMVGEFPHHPSPNLALVLTQPRPHSSLLFLYIVLLIKTMKSINNTSAIRFLCCMHLKSRTYCAILSFAYLYPFIFLTA
jgi:hypothetical protein